MIKAILTDIEGTTTSVSFVYDTLFPYFKAQIDTLVNKLDNPQIKACFEAIKQQIDEQSPNSVSDEQVISQLKEWVAQDKKETHLKTLQGLIWAEAYQSGEITGHIYPDVVPALKAWHDTGLSLNIYSSGSVAAQKLLFGYSDFGDLTPLFDAYFDTHVGHKRESASYTNIAQAMGLSNNAILFLSDIPEELAAAQASGMQVLQLVRPGTSASDQFSGVSTFEEIDLDQFSTAS